MDPLLRALLDERFGPVRQVEKERLPTPYEITKRRLVLLGRQTEVLSGQLDQR